MNKIIENYIINNFDCNNSQLYDDLLKLFAEYSSIYVKNFEEFQDSPNTFFNFLMENIDLIKRFYPKLEDKDIIRCFERLKETLGYQIFSEYKHDEQSTFANIVSHIANRTNKKHVLDVGAGFIPYSSILLGESVPTISSMDKKFWLGDTCLKNLNVNPISQYFTRETNVDDYDLIVGRFPCSAIDSIVYLCRKYNKSYFIQPCDCEMPSQNYFYKKWGIQPTKRDTTPPKSNCIQSESGKFCTIDAIKLPTDEWFGWSTMLPDIDKDIQFYSSYAYNIGASHYIIEDIIIEDIIKRHEKSIEFEDVPTPQQTQFSISSVINKSTRDWFLATDEIDEYVE